jgi:hypothetical protein
MDHDTPAAHTKEGSMISGAEGKALEEGAKLVIKHVVPKVTDYGKMLWSGRKFLILGPARSGKTSFLDYLEYLILRPERQTATTVGVHKREDKILKVGGDSSLTLRVRKPRDVAGQAPIHQIQYIRDYTPHCIVVVLDATKFFDVPASESALEWLREFCGHLDILLASNKSVAKKLKSMTVVMNKWDKIVVAMKDKKEESEYRDLYTSFARDILDGSLHNAFYTKGGENNIDIVPCALVSRTEFRDRLAKELVESIAVSLQRR